LADHTPLVVSFNEAQAKLVVQTADLPLGTLAGMVQSGAIDLEPGFQRRERWAPEKQSALIESFLMNVPVPPIYLAEEEDGTYTAIDGKQRLKAISDYIGGKFQLKKLERLDSAEGYGFEKLPKIIKNALLLRPFLRVVTLLKQTDPLLKYEVFLRLNKGGEALNAQEIRNVAFRGPLNDTVYDLSTHHFLKQQLKIENNRSSAFREMVDAEYVLRFLTLSESYENFSGSLVREMDDYMRENRNASAKVRSEVSAQFTTAISRCEGLWGKRAFRRPDGSGWRDQTLAGMYDAQMIATSHLSEKRYQSIILLKSKVLSETRALFADEDFDQAVRTGTNTPARINYRVERMEEILDNVK
jgi:hypothetical protein